eukprot:1143502-Pelagomonas_calceolata.AAC.1
MLLCFCYLLQGPAKPGEPGVGPLRIWPGGLCVARSIGDLDAGPEIVPVPHIRQAPRWCRCPTYCRSVQSLDSWCRPGAGRVMMPPQGCRLILASDGLWDLMSYSKAVTMTRAKPTSAATAALIQVMDSASIIVVDLLPSEQDTSKHFRFLSQTHVGGVA